MNVLAISNQKGGVGKTTTAISLAAALAEKGSRILLVDLDPQANATSGLGVSKHQPRSVYGVLVRDEPIAEAILPTSVPGLDIVPSSPDMAGAEVELVPLLAREFRLREALPKAGEYDTVLIDCPPSLGLLTVNALVAADPALLPVHGEDHPPDGPALPPAADARVPLPPPPGRPSRLVQGGFGSPFGEGRADRRRRTPPDNV